MRRDARRLWPRFELSRIAMAWDMFRYGLSRNLTIHRGVAFH